MYYIEKTSVYTIIIIHNLEAIKKGVRCREMQSTFVGAVLRVASCDLHAVRPKALATVAGEGAVELRP